MKAEELQIGDLVTVNGKPIHVTLATLNIADTVQPIPLTQEIVSKNAIREYHKIDSIVYYGIGTNDVVRFVIFGDTALDKFSFDTIQLQYVHQLQHLLKLLNLDMEIEL